MNHNIDAANYKTYEVSMNGKNMSLFDSILIANIGDVIVNIPNDIFILADILHKIRKIKQNNTISYSVYGDPLTMVLFGLSD